MMRERTWAIKKTKGLPKVNEADVTAQIRGVLRILGIPHIKHFGTLGSQRGVTDLIGTIPGTGRALWLELKAPGKTPTQEQSDFMETHGRAGGLSFWADSVMTVVSMLAAAGYKPAIRMFKSMKGEK